ncbi:MAG: carboxypeptidase-like regulatory domain-containing protein [Terracidiphilus sp.]
MPAFLMAQATEQANPVAHSFDGAYTIAGTVVNATTGEPVQRALVSVLSETDGREVASVESDAVGHFAIERLAADKYPLIAAKRGYARSFYDEHEGFNTAIVTGPDQDTTHLTFRLTPHATLHGVVTADGGDPVESARVILFEKRQLPGSDEPIHERETAITDDTGAYEFGDLGPGDYLVAVLAQPWYALHNRNRAGASGTENNAQLDVAYPATYFDSTTDEAAATPIALAGGNREQVNLKLHAVPAIRLAVEAPRKADGRLARPQLTQMIFGVPEGSESVGFLDALKTGSTEFEGVAPGHYEMTAGNPQRVLELNAAQSSTVDLNNGIGTVTVTGTVRRTGEAKGPAEAQLFLRPHGTTPSHANLTATVQNGHFQLEGVAPGNWTVTAEAGGPFPSINRIVPVLAITTDSATHTGNALTVQDQPLNVTVILGEGGTARIDGFARKNIKGFAGVLVLLVPKDPATLQVLARRDQSDSDGSFSLRNVLPGRYTIVAIEDAWDLDWTRPEVVARYLAKGTPVTVTNTQDARLQLAAPVTVQSR